MKPRRCGKPMTSPKPKPKPPASPAPSKPQRSQMADPTIDERIEAVEARLNKPVKVDNAADVARFIDIIHRHTIPIITAYREQQDAWEMERAEGREIIGEQQARLEGYEAAFDDQHAEIERLQALQRDHDIHTDRLVTDANQLGVENARLRGFVEAVRQARIDTSATVVDDSTPLFRGCQIIAALAALEQSNE